MLSFFFFFFLHLVKEFDIALSCKQHKSRSFSEDK